MKGNLSKKKGFLGELNNEAIESIADIIAERTGKELETLETELGEVENSIYGIKADIYTINDGTNTRNAEVDDKLSEKEEKSSKVTAEGEEAFLTDKEGASDEKYPSELYVQESLKELRNIALNGYDIAKEALNALLTKEDAANKQMATDDDGSYYSGEMTEMRIYQVIGDHIVNNLYSDDEEKALSAKQGKVLGEELSDLGAYTHGEMIWKEDVNRKILSKAEKEALADGENNEPMFSPYFSAEATKEYVAEKLKESVGESVDLSDYYTKTEVDNKNENIQQDIYDLQADIVGREEKTNKTNTISDQPSTDKYPSEAAVFNYVMSVANDLKLYIGDYSCSKDEVNAAIQSAIGDVLGGAS